MGIKNSRLIEILKKNKLTPQTLTILDYHHLKNKLEKIHALSDVEEVIIRAKIIHFKSKRQQYLNEQEEKEHQKVNEYVGIRREKQNYNPISEEKSILSTNIDTTKNQNFKNKENQISIPLMEEHFI